MKESRQVVDIVRVMLDRVRKDELTSFVGHPSQGAENPPVTTQNTNSTGGPSFNLFFFSSRTV